MFPADSPLKTSQVTPLKNVTISPYLQKREFCRMIGPFSREFSDWWTNLILSQNYLPMIGCFQLPRPKKVVGFAL
jgi:hypothetical protein